MAKAPQIRVQGLNEALFRLDVIGDIGRRGEVQEVLLEAAELIRTQVEQNIDARTTDPWRPHLFKLKDGRTFPIAPGDLKKALAAYGSKSGLGAVAKIDFLKAPHAWVLEFGDKRGRIQPEAFWRNGVAKQKRNVSALIKARLSEMLFEYVDADAPGEVFKRRKKK